MKAASPIQATSPMQATGTTAPFAVPADLRSAGGWVLLGGLFAGSLDLMFAIGGWSLHDIAPIRIVQAVAAWVLGRETAFAGGWRTAALGTALHYYLITALVAGYFVASRSHAPLLHHSLRGGAAYGAVMLVLLHMIVLPVLSVATPASFRPDWMLACLLAYMLLVGIPAALFARHWHSSHPPR